jgi:DNA-binding FrmR family transcriptional regulator
MANGKNMAKKGQSAEISQLHRLEGQLHGIEKMLGSSASLEAVLQQIEAVRGNLKSLEKVLMKQKIKKINNKELQRCFDYLCKIN